MRLLRRREIVCQEAVELVTDHLEGTLSRTDSRRFERHLAGCDDCTEYLAQIRETIRLTGRLTDARGPDPADARRPRRRVSQRAGEGIA
jgi:anti-sigma factor RsiW